MLPEIRTEPIEYTISGHSLRHDPAKSYGQEIMALLGRVWPVIKAGAIANDGINRVVYDNDGEVFAGVVLTGTAAAAEEEKDGLKRKTIRLTRYAYWKHIGPYHLLPVTGAAMRKIIEARATLGWPMIEVYGHWTSDESRLETETFVAVM